jgi:hypothetical protein
MPDPVLYADRTAAKSEIPIAQRMPIRGSYMSGFSTPIGARNPSEMQTFRESQQTTHSCQSFIETVTDL